MTAARRRVSGTAAGRRHEEAARDGMMGSPWVPREAQGVRTTEETTPLTLKSALISVASGLVLGSADFQPPRLVSADLPPISPLAVGWSSSLFVADVAASGRISAAAALTSTGDADLSMNQWVFKPATVGDTPVAAPVLVAVIYRPPTLLTAVPPPDFAQIAKTIPQAVPAPVATTAPPYPPQARGNAVVIVELVIDTNGGVQSATVAASTPGFDEAALGAARTWRFRPASREGTPVASSAYLVLGFREPVIVR